MGPLIRHFLTCDHPDASYTLVRRVLTALIHHCKGPEQFAPACDVVVKNYLDVVKESNEEQVRRVLEVASIVSSVRQGTRITREHDCHPARSRC